MDFNLESKSFRSVMSIVSVIVFSVMAWVLAKSVEHNFSELIETVSKIEVSISDLNQKMGMVLLRQSDHNEKLRDHEERLRRVEQIKQRGG